MFVNSELQNHLETSAHVKVKSFVSAEWNLNSATNIRKIGNYRFRPQLVDNKYSAILNNFDVNDEGNFYTGATKADIIIDGGFNDDDTPAAFTSENEKERLLYSLEDCFSRFRPRSGINKVRYFNNRFLHNTHQEMSRRPRYYMAHKNDQFKYWTSYRTEENVERGIAKNIVNGKYYIDDAAPFVVYDSPMFANRIVIKMQTNTGEIDLGPFYDQSGQIPDPLYGTSNMTIPVEWKIQVLKNNSWVDASVFDSTSTRKNGFPIIASDGYVELYYGLKVPENYENIFKYLGETSSSQLLPSSNMLGAAYLVVESEDSVGTIYIWNGSSYSTFTPEYTWSLYENAIEPYAFTSTLLNDKTFVVQETGERRSREVDQISGIRVVATTMNKLESTLDIIEISPRLAANISEIATNFSVTKSASDLGISGMPVGQLLASVGSLDLFDFEEAFNEFNENSLIYAIDSSSNIQIKIYEQILDVNGYDYTIPIKTLYSESFPNVASPSREVSIDLRDMFFYFESRTAPELFLQNASLSYAISTLLDGIGFSNYVFKRLSTEKDPIIANFFVSPNQTVAQVLNELAVSTQSAMFFDEYNNLVVMTKGYMMASESERATDTTISGNSIMDISSQETKVYNNGKINYSERYIQKNYGSIRQSSLLDKEKTWIYKPVLLWEATGTNNTKSVNGEIAQQSDYVLGAIPLNSDLSADLPYVKNHTIVNNTIDLGEGVYWLTRNSGYFYANGEVIKYDAVQYSVPGISGQSNVWIKDAQEYGKYFASLPFNGKIYPTGLIRIYAEPNYETVDGITSYLNGPVAKHGRGQFGTQVVSHSAGLNKYWSDNNNVRGCLMDFAALFSNADVPATISAAAGKSATIDGIAQKTTRNGVIKNFLSSSTLSESAINSLMSTQSATVQSSALIMNGPSFSTTENPVNYLSYVYKPMTSKFKNFGTRMRVIGKIENNETQSQTPVGSSVYYNVTGTSPEKSINIAGSSGGLAIMVNPETNNGYYFEIAALTQNSFDSDLTSDQIYNVMFYKVKKNASASSSADKAVPIRLWAGLTGINVDDGRFVGQSRILGEENTSVYDLSVEYEDIGSTRRFYLYINNTMVATVDDADPLPVYNNMALFVRGSSRCMFENIYALSNNYSKNTTFLVDTPASNVFSAQEMNASESFRKYALSGILQSTYLSGISPSEPPSHQIYFEEFGTILREASYFNVKYDKAYPALFAKISPTFNRLKGYSVSGFTAGAYGAEFLIFNCTDFALSLDSSSGNYLRIQGITFTQQSTNELTVDNYFNKVGDLSGAELGVFEEAYSPLKYKERFNDIRNSRFTYGNKEFTIDATYIQSQDDAHQLMGWIVNKVMQPRKSVGLSIFAMPTVQLGDIVKIDYTTPTGIKDVALADTRFVVYNIEYTRSDNGPEMTVYLSEVK